MEWGVTLGQYRSIKTAGAQQYIVPDSADMASQRSPPAGRTAAVAHLLVYQGLNVQGLEHIGAELWVEVHLPDALVKQLPHLPTPKPHASSASIRTENRTTDHDKGQKATKQYANKLLEPCSGPQSGRMASVDGTFSLIQHQKLQPKWHSFCPE